MTDTPVSAESNPSGKVSKSRSIEIAPQWMLIFGSVAILVASQFIRADMPAELRASTLSMIPFSLALFYLGVHAVNKGCLPLWIDKPLTAAARWLDITPGQVLSLGFGFIFGILATIAAGFGAFMYSPHAAVLCWVAGILFAVYGGLPILIKRRPIPRGAVFSGAAIFIIALVIRFINTASIPAILSGDEASSGLYALGFLEGKTDNIFIAGWFSFPVFHNFLQSISIQIFGQTIQALRLLAALGGALTVALVFFVGYSMYGFAGGLMAGIFLAGMHFHNHFSRIGLNNIWDGFFLTLTLGFLWIGWQQNRRSAYLVAGLGLGLSQYFYTTGRILPLMILAWLVTAGLTDRKRLRNAIPGLLLMLLIALVVYLPLGWFYLKHPNEFMAPMNRVTIMGSWLQSTAAETGHPQWLVLLGQLWKGFLGYIILPLRAWYIPGVPLLRTLPGIAFMLGIIFMLLNPKDSRNQMLFWWLAAIGAALGLSSDTPAAQRFVAATPAVALVIAFSLQNQGKLLGKLWPKRTKLLEIAMLVIALFLAADDARFYYDKFTRVIGFGGFEDHVAQSLAMRLKKEPTGQEVVFIGYPIMGYQSISSLSYLAPQIKYYDAVVPWGSAEDPEPYGKRVLFVFLPEHEKDQTAVELEYPGGSWSEQLADSGALLFRIYDVNRP